jgi:hypothetical protein
MITLSPTTLIAVTVSAEMKELYGVEMKCNIKNGFYAKRPDTSDCVHTHGVGGVSVSPSGYLTLKFAVTMKQNTPTREAEFLPPWDYVRITNLRIKFDKCKFF